MGTQQIEFEGVAVAAEGTVYVNEHVYVRTEGTRQVICVRGMVFAHYTYTDRAAQAYRMISLYERVMRLNAIGACLWSSERTLRRYQERWRKEG